MEENENDEEKWKQNEKKNGTNDEKSQSEVKNSRKHSQKWHSFESQEQLEVMNKITMTTRTMQKMRRRMKERVFVH